MRTIKLGISFNSAWAFVKSVYYTETACGLTRLLYHSLGCWRDFAVLKFCFQGKPIRIKVGDMMSVETDALDKDFLAFANYVSTYDYKFWKEIYAMLERGNERREVLNHLKTYAIARRLDGKPYCERLQM